MGGIIEPVTGKAIGIDAKVLLPDWIWNRVLGVHTAFINTFDIQVAHRASR